MSEEKKCVWSIRDFPEKVKNEFQGAVKARGLSQQTILSQIIRDWLVRRKLDRGK